MNIIKKIMNLKFQRHGDPSEPIKNDEGYEANITKMVNENNYSSSTQFLIYVDLKNFKTLPHRIFWG